MTIRRRWDVQLHWHSWPLQAGVHVDHTDPSITLHLPCLIIAAGRLKQPGFRREPDQLPTRPAATTRGGPTEMYYPPRTDSPPPPPRPAAAAPVPAAAPPAACTCPQQAGDERCQPHHAPEHHVTDLVRVASHPPQPWETFACDPRTIEGWRANLRLIVNQVHAEAWHAGAAHGLSLQTQQWYIVVTEEQMRQLRLRAPPRS